MHSDLLGPVDGDDYTYRDTFDITSTSYSEPLTDLGNLRLTNTVIGPCGEDTVLNINTAIRVNNANNTKGSGFISTDSVSDGCGFTDQCLISFSFLVDRH